MGTAVFSALKTRVIEAVVDAGGIRLSPLTRFIFGAATGSLPLLLSLLLSPSHRSPYLLAYPAVILSAWLWGIPGSVSCAIVAGAAIEHFIFSTRQIDLASSPTGWIAREGMFLAGSILVGYLTRHAALHREKMATVALQQEIARVQAERSAAQEKEKAAELLLENEVRAHMALDGASAGVWEWDIPNNKSKWSPGFYRLHGLEPGGPASYQIWRGQVHSDDIDRVEVEVHRAVAEVTRFSAEYRVRLPSGDIRWVICEGATSAGSDGKAAMMSGYCGDITRRKLADLALLQTEKLAVAGRLSASIAHEINNPLAAAMNLLYLVKIGGLDEERANYLDESLHQLSRVAEISRQTLSFSRTTQQASHCTPLDLVESTLGLLRPKLQLSRIEVIVETRGNSAFLCTTSEIQQILTNIINNAADAMLPPGRLRIRIADSLDWRTRSTQGVRISIGDTGTGMSRATLEKIFEPFFTTKEGVGTGLGMWVVRELVEKHHGQLTIRSSLAHEHHGTVLSLFFPWSR